MTATCHPMTPAQYDEQIESGNTTHPIIRINQAEDAVEGNFFSRVCTIAKVMLGASDSFDNEKMIEAWNLVYAADNGGVTPNFSK